MTRSSQTTQSDRLDFPLVRLSLVLVFAAIIALLDRHGQSYFRIPFVMDEYASVGWELDWLTERELVFEKDPAGGELNHVGRQLAMRVRRGKNAYVMNNNGARNAALRAGRGNGAQSRGDAPWADWRRRVGGSCYPKA